MTSPVHMEIGDTLSTMEFVMPSHFKKDDLPNPNNTDIVIETTEPEYVAVVQFGGFADTKSIDRHKVILENALKEQVPGGIKTEIKPKHLLPLLLN